MKAVIRHGGKQYYVTEGTVLFLEKIAANENDSVTFDEVLMLDDKIGNPLVKGATVSGKVLKQGKGKKITIYTYKQKGNSNRKKQGHRQPYTKVEITKING